VETKHSAEYRIFTGLEDQLLTVSLEEMQRREAGTVSLRQGALMVVVSFVGMNAMERYLSLTPAHYRRQVTELSTRLIKKRAH
jgi:hypothetical protein